MDPQWNAEGEGIGSEGEDAHSVISYEEIKSPENSSTVEEDQLQDAKGEEGHEEYEEKYSRKRKLRLMNDEQIKLILGGLNEEPDMVDKPFSVDSWSIVLSFHGPRITPMQLKNWLETRRICLARIATQDAQSVENARIESIARYYDHPRPSVEQLMHELNWVQLQDNERK